MKNSIFLLLFVLSSCSSGVMYESPRKDITTLEILESVDTTLQVALKNNEVVYIVRDGLVVGKVVDASWAVVLLLSFSMILSLLVLFMWLLE